MSEKIKIMVVDDSTVIVKMIQGFLKTFDIEVVGTAGDGKTAIEVFKKTSPDIVTLDITMPEMDGLTVLEKILEIKPTTKVIIITALSDNATALKSLRIGAKDYMPKPITEKYFKEVLDRVINED
jgi:two-component system chemotaxis response regulator CheY